MFKSGDVEGSFAFLCLQSASRVVANASDSNGSSVSRPGP